jgi:tetratricopeptide (TPR) repeat protein
MRTLRRGIAALALTVGLVGCSHRPASPTATLETAAERAQQGSPEARTLALAGFHAYLVQGDAEAAKARFEAALAKDPNDAYALQGQHLLARRSAHADRALTAALELTTRAPRHPLATSAARFLLDQVGTAPALDDAILAGTQKALAAGAQGETAQLLRGARLAILSMREDPAALASTLRDMGTAGEATLVGPFSPHHLLSFDAPTPPEKDGALAGPFSGPFGPLPLRTLRAPDGRLDLSGEPGEGDIYLLAFDAEVPQDGLYVVRSVSHTSHRVLLDGAPVFERRVFTRTAPTVTARAVRLSAGKHRFLVKLSKEQTSGAFSFSLPRVDGQPSGVRMTAATGPAPTWGASPSFSEPTGFYPAAADLAGALVEEAGSLLATFLAVHDGMGRDHDGAKRLLAGLEASAFTSAPLLTLRAELAANDRTLPTKVARGRATRDLEVALGKDKGDVVALMLRAGLSLNDNQPAAAMETLKAAREAAGPSGFPVLLMMTRAALALDVDAQAEDLITQALEAQVGLCEALGVRYSLARRRDAVARADETVTALRQCPGGLSRAAEHARLRGDLASAARAQETLLARDPSSLNAGASLAATYVSQRRFEEATATMRALATLWPRNTTVLKRLADVREYAGDAAGALALREQALALDGGDLALRRAVERTKTGKELLQEQAIDGKAAIAAYEASRGTEDSAAAYVLDAAAVRVYPDGSVVNRIHTIQKALEQGGIQDIAEVRIPQGAQVLALRTIKADGRVLEPENIEGKETVSLPGVQVGDYAEVEYLLAEDGRGPAQPGFAASAFYFQISGMPNHHATYTVLAPKGTGMRVDAHNMRTSEPKVQGDLEVFHHEARRVPPFIPEPNAPSSANEYLPFVVLGAGTTGNDALVTVYADAFLDRAFINSEVEAFAREAAAGKQGLEAVKALHAAVMKRVTGRDLGLAQSASATVSQDRGSRLMLMKAGLEVLGIPSRLAVVRTFSADPAPYLFPESALLPYAGLRVEVPGEQPVWLDTAVRFGPFGELPEPAMGEREAYLLPEPGKPLEKVKTPPLKEDLGKQVKLALELTEDGRLRGKGEEVYSGFEAAQLAEAFEQLGAESRKQALQGAVARYFGGAELSSVKLEHAEEVGAPFILRYEFTVPGFARAEGNNRLALGPLTFPSMLGREYVQLSSRNTPLLLDRTQSSRVQVALTLPQGWKLVDPQANLKVDGKFGRYLRSEKQEGRTLTIDETLRLYRNRVTPKAYEEFSQFTGDVDLLQTRDLFVVKP